MNIIETVKSSLEEMTKSDRRIATHFINDPHAFAFETLDTIATEIGISTTSVIRFARKLGFTGYKEFQESVRLDFKHELTLPDKLNRSFDEGVQDVQLSRTLRNTVNCIEETFKTIPSSSIHDAVNAMAMARRVFCFGLKESYALAHYAYTRFLTVRGDVYILSAGHSGEIESVLSLNENDVCIFFLFHRYTKPAPEILKILKKQGVKVILVTSPPYDELSVDDTILLPCFVDINGIKNSAVAPICLTDHLCNSVVVASREKSLDYMKKSEALFKDFTF